METLLALDHQIFLTINHMPHTGLTDWFALWLSGIGVGGLIWLMLSVWLFLKVEKKDHWFFLPVVVATAASQFMSNMFLKEFFDRNRPPESLGTIYVTSPPGDNSFPSGHATFAWALALVLSAKEPRAQYLFFFLALLISFSRMYLGMHYPADVVSGGLIGLLIGWGSLWLEKKVTYHRIRRRKS